MDYPEHEAVLALGESVLLYSDGIVEAHDRAGAMFGFPRLRELMATEHSGGDLLEELLEEVRGFVGRGWEQEDDITLVALQRTGGPGTAIAEAATAPELEPTDDRVLLHLSLPGEAGSERRAADEVAGAVEGLGITAARLERLKTAVSEAAMNAVEYGSQNDPMIPFEVLAVVEAADLVVRITDRGLGGSLGDALGDAEEPDIEKKLAGEQRSRGWGLFLIRHMVDAVEVATHGTGRTVTLTLHLEGDSDAGHPVPG
jgi:anti-sigma regulatory factor (Ser/Thr protein kinase)